MLAKLFVTFLTNYVHCPSWCGYHTVLFYTLLCPQPSSCPNTAFQPPPGTYYYIIHTQSDIPITSGEKSHILWKQGDADFWAKGAKFWLKHAPLFNKSL